jgi:surface carbohydrate biosynthesis protein (TIGR04326 family)
MAIASRCSDAVPAFRAADGQQVVATGTTLLVTSDPLDALAPGALEAGVGSGAVVLSLNGGSGEGVLPAGSTCVQPEELGTAAELRQQFVDFLEAWPTLTVRHGRSFNDVFRVGGGYSLWWASIGADRQVTHGIFKYFRYAALVDRAIARWAPAEVLLLTGDRLCATLVGSRCEHAGIAVRPLPGCAKPLSDRVAVGRGWLARSLWHAVGSPVMRVALAVRSRWVLRRAELFRGSTRPTVVFASRFARNMSLRDGRFSALNWTEVGEALKQVEPDVEQVYLPRNLEQIVDEEASASRGLDALAHVRAPLLIWERHFPLRGAVSTILRQMAAVWRFYRLAGRDDFRRSFRFANTDMAPLLVPELKEAMNRAVDWSFKRAQVAGALGAAGNVRAVLVSGEMYKPAMPTLAGAAAAGIPTIGVQHANIMPTHLVYTLPRGHIAHAPVPDYFAAYGEYAREVVSVHGAYPADRVWITGAARLDPIVNRRIDPVAARRALGLPAERPVVVLATQTFPWFVSAMRGLLECLRDHPDVVLCVKKHPSARAMSLDGFGAMAAGLGVRDVRGFEGQLDLLLAACTVWISASSTTTLEATLIGKPTICLNFSGHADRYPYVEEGVSLPARSVDELKRSLARALAPSRALDDEARRTWFLRRHVGPTTDGAAAITLARRVSLLLRTGR